MKIEGRDKLLKKLAALSAEVRAQVKPAIEKSAAEIANQARNFAPEDSGDLKKSIGYTFGEYKPANSRVRGFGAAGGKADPDLTVTIHAGDAKAFYAAWQEFGTTKMSAQPYFFPAYRLGKKRAKGRITRAMTKAAKKIAADGQ